MTSIWVFPGQGSQHRGMSAALLDRYASVVAQADEVLGYSVRRLITEDPDNVLNQTEFTQPALYVATALSFLEKRDSGAPLPQFYAGHSLGEFNALFAAGAFDFATGVALVKRRGQLMARAPRGAMAAVLGLEHTKVGEILAASPYERINIANINSRTQIVVSGPLEEIESCESLFTQAGAKYVRLNVSAAFHSGLMQGVQEEFAQFVSAIALQPLRAEVISNYTAGPYPRTDYHDLLIQQITHPVRWYESVSGLLSRGELSFEEVGPGRVLSKLFEKIKTEPANDGQPTASRSAADIHIPVKRRTVFMYSGQGSQYYLMGQELYRHDAIFRESMDACDQVHVSLTGKSVIAQLYDEAKKYDELADISISHPALFSLGYSLTRVLIDRKVQPDCVLGYSLGEYVAAVVAGALTLESAMALVVEQARLLRERTSGGGMLTVLSPVDHFERNPSLYAGGTLASVNFEKNFVVSGRQEALVRIKARLDELPVVSALLPVQHGFHSSAVDPIEAEFRRFAQSVPTQSPRLPIYSSVRRSEVGSLDGQYFWDVIRNKVDFHGLMEQMNRASEFRFVDLGPTGTLSTFIKYGFADRVPHAACMNQFGKNLQTVSKLVAEFAV